MADERRYQVWLDVSGDTALTYATGNAVLTPVFAQIDALSNAVFITEVESLLVVNGAPAPASAVYRSVLDQAVLVYACVDGTELRVTIPAPLASLFLADGLTVNPASIVGLNAAVIGTLVSSTSSPALTYLSGTRVRKSQSLLK